MKAGEEKSMAVSSILLALAIQAAPPTVAEAMALPPAAAGDRLLAGETHGPIVAVERDMTPGPIPPGFATLYLYERARRVAGGCARRKWTVDYRAVSGARTDAAAVTGRRASDEVGLAERGSCARARFVGFSGVEAGRALSLLAALARWRARPGGVELRCTSDEVRAAVCASVDATRAALARAVPWNVPRDLTVWARVDGGLGYSISFDGLPPTTIAVDARVPAPF